MTHIILLCMIFGLINFLSIEHRYYTVLEYEMIIILITVLVQLATFIKALTILFIIFKSIP
jgi:hypothetical protein